MPGIVLGLPQKCDAQKFEYPKNRQSAATKSATFTSVTSTSSTPLSTNIPKAAKNNH